MTLPCALTCEPPIDFIMQDAEQIILADDA